MYAASKESWDTSVSPVLRLFGPWTFASSLRTRLM